MFGILEVEKVEWILILALDFNKQESSENK